MNEAARPDQLNPKDLLAVRCCLVVVAVGLILAGATCYFLPWELEVLVRVLSSSPLSSLGLLDPVRAFILDTQVAANTVLIDHPQLYLGTDYLGFAHFILGVLFLGAMRDPRRNLWVIDFGILSSVAVIPCAFIFGQARGVPLLHSFVDASFGLIALPFLIYPRILLNRQAPLGS